MNWLLNTSAGTLTRIAAGVTIFLCLALWDLKKHRRGATRWREYLFLLACVAAAMVYGALNDQVTSRISWEYFYYGKELQAALGPEIPPDRRALDWEAAKIGMQATWSVGLILGAALLIANNPSKRRPQVPYRTMLAMLPVIVLLAGAYGAVFGVLGWNGKLNGFSADFRDMWRENYFRPRHFMATWGAHLGGYIGGLFGGAGAVIWVVRRRRTAHLA